MARFRRLNPYLFQTATGLKLTKLPRPQILPFVDNFNRADGALGNGWIAPTWLISGNKIANDPTSGSSEMFANPGCEGTYVSGLTPNWGHYGTCTRLEEDTIIHGGSKAQKVIGDVVTSSGVGPDAITVTIDRWYMFNGWIRNDGPGNVYAKRNSSRLANINILVGPTSSVYKHILGYDVAASTGVETIVAEQSGTTPTTWYVDDWSLKSFTYTNLFALHSYLAVNFVCKVAINYVYPGEAGIMVSLDDPANPLNYMFAEVRSNGTMISLWKCLNGTRTLTAATASITPVAGETLEIRKIGTTYKLYYAGRQVGPDVTVTDAAILNGHYVGMYSYGSSTIDNFSICQYGWPLSYTVPDYSGYYTAEHYTAGQGIVSLRFDDDDYRNYTVIYPLLAARSLKAGFSVVRNGIGYTNCLTLSQLLEMQTAGMEIMCHSFTHTAPPDWPTFVDETEGALMEMRALGLDVCSFVMPGSWLADPYFIDNIDHYGSSVDVFLRRWFKYYMASITPDLSWYRALPRVQTWGSGYWSINYMTLASFEFYVDRCALNGYGMDVVCHVQNLDTTGNMTLTDLTSALDYLAAAVAAGSIVVKTPTAQIFATPS
jgi:hypothetical protein